jgi:MtN3 and saliva related transmembrane protein
MSPETINMIGYVAAFLTTISFFPQAAQTLKTRKTKDISLGMYLAFTTGVFFWGIYGVLLDSVPMILANSVTLVLAGIILFIKIKNG